MPKLRCKGSESQSFIVAAEVLQPRAMLSAGATAAHALRHAASHTADSTHPAVTPATFAGFDGAINGSGDIGNTLISFAGTLTISPFQIKRNATVSVTFSVTTNGTNLLIEGAYKFKARDFVFDQGGTDIAIEGPETSVSGHAGPDKIGKADSQHRVVGIHILNNNLIAVGGSFLIHSGKTKTDLFMTFD